MIINYENKDNFPPELVKSFDAWLAGNLSGINNTLLVNKSKYDNKKFICSPDKMEDHQLVFVLVGMPLQKKNTKKRLKNMARKKKTIKKMIRKSASKIMKRIKSR